MVKTEIVRSLPHNNCMIMFNLINPMQSRLTKLYNRSNSLKLTFRNTDSGIIDHTSNLMEYGSKIKGSVTVLC